MGEMADAALNGDMCQSCGEWLGNGDGYPVTCDGCKLDQKKKKGAVTFVSKRTFRERSNPFVCLSCGSWKFKSQEALDQHQKDKNHRKEKS